MPTGALTVGGMLLIALLLPGCTLEQILIGQRYTIYTPAAGACPALAWRFVVGAERAITGGLYSEAQAQVASLSGVLGPDDSFRMTATAGERTAQVTGQFTSQVSTIVVHGDAAGPGCDGQSFALRLGGYFARAGGGGGGGDG